MALVLHLAGVSRGNLDVTTFGLAGLAFLAFAAAVSGWPPWRSWAEAQ